MNRKIIIFGIDGASLDFIFSQIEKGALTNFQRLIEDGSWGRLCSTVIPNSSVAWTTFMTGKNPGKHGIHDFFHLKKGAIKFVSFSDIEDKPFWDVLGDAGKKSFVINCPLTYPPKIENGIMVSGFQTPPNRKDFVCPTDFWKEIDNVSPGYKVYPQINIGKDLRGHIKEIDKVLKSQLDLVWHIFKKKDWDLLVYVMQNIDALQHFLWNYIDKTHTQYKFDSFFSNVLFKFYNILDEFLGRIISSMDEDTCLFIVSDHGVGKAEKQFFLNNWLLKNKYLFLRSKSPTNMKKALMKLGICEADFYNIFVADNPIAKVVNSLIKGKRRAKKSRIFYTVKDIDWDRTLAHGVNTNQIFINSKSDYENTRNDLIEKLKGIKNPYKDKPLIDMIYKKEDVFFGDRLSSLPDIVYSCDGFEIVSPGEYKVTSPFVFDNTDWTGDHRLDGILFCYGKGVRKGFEVKDARIEDIPSTVIAISEGLVPEDFDGKVLKEMFSKGFLGEIRKQKIFTKKRQKGKGYSVSQEAEVKKTLESLGYI